MAVRTYRSIALSPTVWGDSCTILIGAAGLSNDRDRDLIPGDEKVKETSSWGQYSRESSFGHVVGAENTDGEIEVDETIFSIRVEGDLIFIYFLLARRCHLCPMNHGGRPQVSLGEHNEAQRAQSLPLH